MKTLNDLLDKAAAESGGKPALVTQQESIDFAELRRQVLAAAAGFAAAGVKKGDSVAIVQRNGPAFVVCYFALSRLGAVAVPINFMVQKADELAYMLNDCRAVAVITQKEFLRGLRAAAAKAGSVTRVWVAGADAAGLQGNERPVSELLGFPGFSQDHSAIEESDVAAILYTSGTTGTPKGVMLTHRNLVTNATAAAASMRMRGDDVALCILPMFHSFAWTGNVLVSVLKRTKLVISPSITPAKPWLSLMGRHGVSLFSAVPQIYSVLAKQCAGLQRLYLKYWAFRRVRMAVSGAAPLSPAVADAFERAFGLPILEGFGLTETSPVVTANPPDRPKRGSVGKPIDGARLKIIGEDERELRIGEEGEICVQGDCVMKGYYHLPDATRQAFTKDGWLKTGDIGALDEDGYLYIRDRMKDMIIIKGLKVFSAQVETTLLEHPDVAEAAVIGVPDEHGDETIKAFIVLKTGAKSGRAEIMQFCKARFDPYKRPRDVEIVDALPKNALQKVLKRSLRQRELEKKRAASAP